MIPISHVQLAPGTEALVLDVLGSGQIAQGPLVARFEEEFAQLTGVQHAIAVNNGTSALIAALRVLDLQPGDEVLTSPFTFVATLNAILDSGATATFADIGDADFNLDAAAVADALTDRTAVLLPVHLYGQCADLDAFQALASDRGLRLVEDSAQAHGATIGTRRAGSAGIGCFSFYATKNLTTGEGGMITTDDDAVADRLRLLRNQGMRARYQYELPGGNNYRMTDVQAAIGLPQLRNYTENVERRRANAATLTAGLAGVEGLVTPVELPGRGHVWHQYTVRVTSDAAIDRDQLVERLHELGVGCGVYYPRLVFDYDCYRDHPRIRIPHLPVASRVSSEVVSLPVHPGLGSDDLDRIVTALRTAMGA